ALAFQRLAGVFAGFGDADGVDEHEAGLGAGVRCDLFEVGVGDGAHAAAVHLLVIAFGVGVAQEQQRVDGFDVGAGGDVGDGAGGDHGHGDGDARHGVVAKGVDEAFRVVIAAVGDFLGKVVALAEDFARDVDDFLGVVVVLGEDERLGQPVAAAAGEQFREYPVAVGLQNGADLVGVDHGAVEILAGVVQVVIQ